MVLQMPEILDQKVMMHLMQTPWTRSAFLTCKLPKEQDDACQQVAMLLRCSQFETVQQVTLPLMQNALTCHAMSPQACATHAHSRLKCTLLSCVQY